MESDPHTGLPPGWLYDLTEDGNGGPRHVWTDGTSQITADYSRGALDVIVEACVPLGLANDLADALEAAVEYLREWADA